MTFLIFKTSFTAFCLGKGLMKKDQATNNINSNEDEQQGSAAEWLVEDIINSRAVLFHDQRNVAYIAYEGNGTKVDRIASNDFKQWLYYQHWTKTRKPMPRDTDTKVIQTLTGYARHEGKHYPLSVRFAKNDLGLWYDLGNGPAIHITATGWTVNETPPILFRRYPHQQTQVEPMPGGDIDLLRPFINISDQDNESWLLFVINLITAFVPGFPHPILILYGPQGAGKTTPMRVMKKLIDPSVLLGTVLPAKEAEFAQIADHHAFLFFDNISNITLKMSDALARASTGDGFNSRELYTTDDDFIRIIQRPIAINGINQVVVKPDLLDRSILIKLDRIKKEDRQPEEVYWEAFEGIRPQLLGAIFDVLSKSLAVYPTIHLTDTPRMADFARLGCAVAEAIGMPQEQFIVAYDNNINLQNDEAIEASPVAKAIIALMAECDVWQSTPADLLRKLNRDLNTLDLTNSPLWPKDPVWMTRRLNEVQTNLEVLGIHIEVYRTADGRHVTITKDSELTADTDIPPEETDDDSMSVMTLNI